MDMPEEYLIISHGLYFRPNARGYTGIRAEAGLYTKEEAEKYTDAEIVHVSKAKEFMPDTYTDLVVRHLKAEIAKRDAVIAEMREALEDIKSVERSEFIGAPSYWMEKCINRAIEAITKSNEILESRDD